MADIHPLKGSCLCQAIKYEVKEIKPHMAHCHCSMCRKFHGAAFSTFGVVEKKNFRWITGTNLLKTYEDANGTKRQFCSECGSSLIFIPSEDTGDTVEFALGTLDTPIQEKPDAHIYCSSKANWYDISDQLPQYKEGREE
ncbi:MULTISPECIES: GFA family protein [unclassified Neptuniibacter]|uniref:GFA family protein n=1 Tax=unclassified Neptuniibacter TaxID=2630693 RepID=UPI000C5DA759|nr:MULTISPECIES: GFA family protein [unclassified Neptuniibacter]MAY41019.1 ribulose phosphate epimerase [Oceanospirillaceae bacterium]|tara:strand:+ start:2921 stop:3340 length:420 start_codon:yes stop_codon:yes gene_type:complete